MSSWIVLRTRPSSVACTTSSSHTDWTKLTTAYLPHRLDVMSQRILTKIGHTTATRMIAMIAETEGRQHHTMTAHHDMGEHRGTKIRVDNLHYELTEEDLRDLFERIGPTTSVRLLYDRADRSLGTAYVIYEDPRDARAAVDDFDGQMANGQPIRLQLMPSGPGPRAPAASLADRMEKPPRSLFDRIEGGRSGGRQNSRDGGGRRRYRSDSPQKDRLAPPDVDRYVPGRGSRSPIRRRGTPREGGRRPGERRERGGGGRGGRGGRTDEEGRPVVGGRPKKTAEELDAEMADYWSGSKTDAAADNGAPAANDTNGGDIDMDI
ncbi:hypothetical protein CLAFUW4_06135 [Fulvia fulva]|uniref:RRM domain-containing protein n=1 Tax=Passalora fulva TaxID=5499 RepID=A0A9Q8LHC7_PASFU|nr:uncharacterized protein CLAFUR5_06279 [Fulvia fulva]KAK4623969.1 hypothetical protein CLAFUR4_06139 [Fulvia fulva]KAK4625236.1 hypothetical protein CLAFUR0_06143 [Fulvia fulva]UJO17479.1 hypothetical protein CLAFUR5_06279 [Fulvia fulva]WPV15407.1 hypothetical protein CLAFUW4_06135 [Fulvia fulva]WPV29872.1 hypothetical protein CLAFUW7_06132 [Fulvia fulva]